MKLLRINGDAGVYVYDATFWTVDEAREDYLDSTGFQPYEGESVLRFDAMSGIELIDFLRTGE
jgi:hypothetical protein